MLRRCYVSEHRAPPVPYHYLQRLVPIPGAFEAVEQRDFSGIEGIDRTEHPMGGISTDRQITLAGAVLPPFVEDKSATGQGCHRFQRRRRHPLAETQWVQIGTVGQVEGSGSHGRAPNFGAQRREYPD
jgi:hypothetical protein